MSEDVYQKLVGLSSPEDVKNVLSECGCKLVESGESKSESEDAAGEDAMVEIEVSADGKPEDEKKPKPFGSKLSDAVTEAMGASRG